MKISLFLTYLILILSPTIAHSIHETNDNALIVSHVNIYTDPYSKPLTNHHVLIKDGLIVAISRVITLPGALVIDGKGKSLVAGYWNSHVHFTGIKWWHTRFRSNSTPKSYFVEEFFQYGITSVYDTGSNPANLDYILSETKNSGLESPNIYRTNGGYASAGGTPHYLWPIKLDEVSSQSIDGSSIAKVLEKFDGVKIYSSSDVGDNKIVVVPPETISTIVDYAHKQGAPVFAHAHDEKGLISAIAGGG